MTIVWKNAVYQAVELPHLHTAHQHRQSGRSRRSQDSWSLDTSAGKALSRHTPLQSGRWGHCPAQRTPAHEHQHLQRKTATVFSFRWLKNVLLTNEHLRVRYKYRWLLAYSSCLVLVNTKLSKLLRNQQIRASLRKVIATVVCWCEVKHGLGESMMQAQCQLVQHVFSSTYIPVPWELCCYICNITDVTWLSMQHH